jgi:hypothetical protein
MNYCLSDLVNDFLNEDLDGWLNNQLSQSLFLHYRFNNMQSV